MAAFLDACRFNASAGGTTDWTYVSAVQGYNSPALAGVVNGRAYKYRAESADLAQWEIGEGTYNTASGVLTRSTVLYNSAGTGNAFGQSGAGARINFSAPPQVAIIAIKEDLLAIEEGNAYFTATQQAQARSNLGMSSEIGKIEWWPCSDVPAGRLRADGASYARAAYPDLAAYLIKSGAATFTNGSANVGMTAHGRAVNDPIKLFTTGTLPTNFSQSTHGLGTVGIMYYVKTVVDTNTVQLSALPGGAAFTAGSAGSGTHVWVCAPHGDGDGATTFTVPDYRGDFLRGLDNGAGIDAGRSVGSLQLDALQGHKHSLTSYSVLSSSPVGGTVNGVAQAGQGTYAPPTTDGPVTDGTNGTPRMAAETRPRNVAALVTIRAAA